MTSRRATVLAAASLVVATVSLVLVFMLGGRTSDPAPTALPAGAPGAVSTEPGRTITARLFYVADDGMRLVSVEREVPFADGIDQARAILSAQLAPVEAPLVSAVPAGTTLRALFITDRGDAYVDLSREAASVHPGGTMNELLTVYTIVDALTVNLPAVRAVQILVDGREVQTLAGHVDLRQPLAKNLGLVQ
jgi:spore germination protein GerM